MRGGWSGSALSDPFDGICSNVTLGVRNGTDTRPQPFSSCEPGHTAVAPRDVISNMDLVCFLTAFRRAGGNAPPVDTAMSTTQKCSALAGGHARSDADQG